MEKRLKKYNLIVIMLIILIPVVYCLSNYFESVSQMQIIDQVTDSVIQDTPVEKPSIPEDVTGSTQAPIFKTGMEAVEYAVGILSTNISFDCDLYHRTTCAGVGAVDVLMKQTRYKNHDIMRVWTECSVPVSAGNFYKTMYTNHEQEQIRYIYDTSRFDFASKTYRFAEGDILEGEPYIEGFVESDKVNGWCSFFTSVNSTLGREVYFDKSNKDYYTVKVIMHQNKLNESSYARNMVNEGVISCDLKKLNMTFTIDRKTGYLLTCAREETFVVNVGVSDLLTCNATGVHTYRYQDTKDLVQEIIKNDLFVGF